MINFNIWAAIAAALSSFMLGGLWYSRILFGATWNREAGRDGDCEQGHPAKVFGLSFVFALIGAVGFASTLGPSPELGTAVLRGLLVGACLVATSFGINYQFANRSTLMWLIDAGYHTVQFVLFGIVLGLWH